MFDGCFEVNGHIESFKNGSACDIVRGVAPEILAEKGRNWSRTMSVSVSFVPDHKGVRISNFHKIARAQRKAAHMC